MKKKWEIMHTGHSIRVENTWFRGEKLFVDGVLQDQQIGIRFSSRLFGKVEIEADKYEQIKVSIGSIVKMHCQIFVGDRLVYSSM